MFNKKFIGIFGNISQIIGLMVSYFFLKEIVYLPEGELVKSGRIFSPQSGKTYYYALIDPSQKWLFWFGALFVLMGSFLILIKEFRK